MKLLFVVAEIAFCAFRTSAVSSATYKITFNGTTVNDGNGFNLVENNFAPPANGLYWLTFSAAFNPSTIADVRLVGADRAPNILREHTSWTGYDTTSRSELTTLIPDLNIIHLSSDSALFSNSLNQISFCGFQLNNVMELVAGFSVGRSTPLSTTGQIVYDYVNVDTNSGWNVNRYIVPYTGTWVITFQVGVESGGDSRVELYAPSNVTSLVFYSTNNAGTDTQSKTVVLTISAGSAIYTTLVDAPVYSDIRYQTSLMGFYYSPNLLQPISWCVATESSATGLLNPVPFDIVLINEGGGWNIAINVYLVPTSGVYYVHLSAGINLGDDTNMELLVNNVATINVYRSSLSHNGIDNRGRSYILRLQANDQLQIRLPTGFSLFSNANRITMFSGFRIY